MELGEIQAFVRAGRYEVSFHAQQERLEDDLDLDQIEAAIVDRGEILEQYPDDPRGESCLLLGFVGNAPVHVVLGWAAMHLTTDKLLRIITVYRPTVPKWIDPRTRGGRV